MIKCILIDDELHALRSLKWELLNFCEDIEIIGSYNSPKDAIRAINDLKPDCIFLDLQMPDMDGFQLLNKLEYKNLDPIITTAFDSYTLLDFKKNNLTYLLKPIDTDDLRNAISMVRNNKLNNNLGNGLSKFLQSAGQKDGLNKISVSLADKTNFIDPEKISYCYFDGYNTNVHFINKTNELLTLKIEKVQKMINSPLIFRVHYSYLVNINNIFNFDAKIGNLVELKDGEKIPVSISRRQNLLDLLSSQKTI